MKRSFPVFALILFFLVSGCTTVTDEDLAALDSSNPVTKEEAINRLAKAPGFPLSHMGPLVSRDNEEKAVTILVDFLQDPREARDTQLRILKALKRFCKTTRVPPAPLIEKLKNEDSRIRKKTIEVLGVAKRPEALPALLKQLEDKENRYEVIWALGEIGDPSAIPRLNQLLASADEYDRYNAQRALGKIGGSGASGGSVIKAPLISDQKGQKSVRGHEGSGSTPSGNALAMAKGKPGTNGLQVNERRSRNQASNRIQQTKVSQPRQGTATQTRPKHTVKPVSAESSNRAQSTRGVEAGQRPSSSGFSSNQREKRQTRVSQQVRPAESGAQKKPEALALAVGTQRLQTSVPLPRTSPVNHRPSPAPIGEIGRKRVTAQSGGPGVSEDAAALYLQGLAFQKEGSLEEAKKMYEAALKVSPNLASAWNNMGTIHMKERNYGSAIIAFQKALRIKPQDADPYYNLACLYALQKNVSQSLAYLRKAVTVDEAARQWAMTDDDLKSLRGHSEFKKIVDSSTDL